MAKHHEAFKALGKIDWENVPTDDLDAFLKGVFRDAQIIVESVPSPTSAATAVTQRARARTESAIEAGDLQLSPTSRLSPEAFSQATQLQKDWKEVKVNPRENPLGINVFKLASKDGNGAWFARRSVHEAPSFDLWKLGLEKELAETLKSSKPLGNSNIRGIGAEKRVEHHDIPGTGYLDVFQLYAQFPGPTSPRDFITLLLGSDCFPDKQNSSQRLRQFMIVSRPCNHPETPPRQGIIRGQYESVEFIREVPAENLPPRRSMSSNNLTGQGRNKANGASDGRDTPATVVEWLMVTRSDPGGSVPRFMIERGTPPGIVNDAGKFLKWLSSKTAESLCRPETNIDSKSMLSIHDEHQNPELAQASMSRKDDGESEDDDSQNAADNNAFMSNSGLYGMMTGAFGAATSMATGFRRQFTPLGVDGSQHSTNMLEVQEESQDDSTSDVSSLRSFASALSRGPDDDVDPESVEGSRSDEAKPSSNSQEDKELKRLEDRRRRLEEKTTRMQERMEQKRQEGRAKDEASLAKAREKHERELAKQEAKYQRELQKLEEKRENERRKNEERKRKAAEREEKANLTLELDKVRTERDLAHQEIKLLRGQVGDLQAQNTKLVAALGRAEASASSSSQDLTATPRKGPASASAQQQVLHS